jgi:TrmH family RNA methyltransferase
MPPITGRSNPKLKEVRALKQRKARAESGLFVVEGIRHVAEAVEAGAPIEYLVVCPELLSSPFGRELVQDQRTRGLPIHTTTPAVFATLSERENPTGLLAVVRQQRRAFETLTPANLDWAVAVVAPQDPGNIGTIVRTIDAVGAGALLLLDSGVDPYHPSAVRASLGSLFWVPFAQAAFSEFARWSSQHAYHVYGSSARAQGSAEVQAVTAYARPAILLLGGEREGLTSDQFAVCEQVLRLPMRGRATSLNLAVAAGVLLYDMLAKLPPQPPSSSSE